MLTIQWDADIFRSKRTYQRTVPHESYVCIHYELMCACIPEDHASITVHDDPFAFALCVRVRVYYVDSCWGVLPARDRIGGGDAESDHRP